MKVLAIIGYWLVVIGGVNWGLVGLGWLINGSDWNVVHMIVGSLGTSVEGGIYVLVGLATVWMVAMTKGMPKM